MLYRLVINSTQIDGLKIHLLPSQFHYLKTVLRLNNGHQFIAMDGKGNGWEVKLTDTGGEIISSITENRELPIDVTLMIALPKGSGFEDIIRCTTELGVNQIIPVIADRTLLKPNQNKIERWRKIAREAVEQCERQIVPYIADPIPFFQGITQVKELNCHCYLAVARKNSPSLFSSLQENLVVNNTKQIIIATGSEGGWTPDEIQKAIAYNFQPVSLGNRILRAVTAPIMAMSLISAIFEE